jgi:CBS domain-containing protein
VKSNIQKEIQMTVKDLMTSVVEFVHPDDFLDKAAKKMIRRNVGSIPVLDKDKNPIGIITDRDIVTRVVSVRLNPTETEAIKVMTHNPLFCKETDDIKTAAEIMKDNQVRRLLVQDDHGNLTGIVSLGDLALNAGHLLAGEVLKEVSRPPGS